MNIRTKYGARKISVIHKSVTASTNADALLLPAGTLVTADSQTSGRGRLGRTFVSPPGGVYMSLSLGADADLSFITTAAAAAAARSAEDLCGAPLYIKWVNDLYKDGKKVCGILAQTGLQNGKVKNAVLGLGLNLVKRREFDEELAQKAGYLFEAGDFEELRDRFITRFLTEFFEIYEKKDRERIYNEYKSRDFLRGKSVNYEIGGKAYTGTAAGVDKNINLLVKRGDTVTALNAGEVTLFGIK